MVRNESNMITVSLSDSDGSAQAQVIVMVSGTRSCLT